MPWKPRLKISRFANILDFAVRKKIDMFADTKPNTLWVCNYVSFSKHLTTPHESTTHRFFKRSTKNFLWLTLWKTPGWMKIDNDVKQLIYDASGNNFRQQWRTFSQQRPINGKTNNLGLKTENTAHLSSIFMISISIGLLVKDESFFQYFNRFASHHHI